MVKKISSLHTGNFPRWLKYSLRTIGVLIVVFLCGYFFLAYYVNTHKKELLASITKSLNENLTGTLSVQSMEPAFLQGFPRLSLTLHKVTIQDSLYSQHKNLLLSAEDFGISVNALAMLRGTIEIKKISISNATINLYTDESGYSNSSVFKKSEKKSADGGADYPELRNFDLENVTFTINNLNKKKRYDFVINDLSGDVNYTSKGIDARIKVNTLAKSMAFSTKKGSFIKDKIVDGTFKIRYSDDTQIIQVLPNDLDIGGEDFTVWANFESAEGSSKYDIHIKNDKIYWKNASALLSPNITSRLDMFDLEDPIAVTCDIVGDFNILGDPLIHVKTQIIDNVLSTPGEAIEKCNFRGEFINHYDKAKGFNDKNSAILLYDFRGDYAEIPIVMKRASILDFEKPIAVGDFASNFDVSKLNNIIDADLLLFSKGTAKINVNYRADIVNYKLTKPTVEGRIEIVKTDMKYVARNLDFKDISVLLNFVDENLFISNIHLRSGKSVVDMEGNIQNFLNLYYTAPEKIVLNWEINSPQLNLGEFMGFLGSRKSTTVTTKSKATANFTPELNLLFEKSNVNMKLRVDKIFYNKFLATNATADIFLTENGINLKNAGFRHAGGIIKVNGTLSQKERSNPYAINAVVSKVDVSRFFKSFNNFGLESITSENLKGVLSTKANLSGRISDAGVMVPNSMTGDVAFNLQKGALVNLGVVKNVGKFAFPFRDLSNIDIAELNGALDLRGEKVEISPMQINSSVLNMDLRGVYSFGKGTQIFVDVPLRNPERDKKITSEEELARRRNRGIVVHLLAEDDVDGKVKVKLTGKKD